MSFEDYAKHIYQKHCIGVAIAVLKSKPPNLTSIEYLEQLKSKMVDQTAANMADDDVTSDDFLMDYDDSDDERGIGDVNNQMAGEEGSIGGVDGQSSLQIPVNLSQITYYDSQSQVIDSNTQSTIGYATNDENNITIDLTNCENITENTFKTKKVDMVIEKSNINNTILNTNKLSKAINEINTQNTNYDSQNTIIYDVDAFPKKQHFTHYSQSQNEITVPNKHLYGTKMDPEQSKINEDSNLVKHNEITIANKHLYATENEAVMTKLNEKDNLNKQNDIILNKIDVTAKANEGEQICLSVYQDESKINAIDKYNDLLMFSQSQDFIVDPNIDIGANSVLQTQNNSNISKEVSQNLDYFFDEIQKLDENCRQTVINHNFSKNISTTDNNNKFETNIITSSNKNADNQMEMYTIDDITTKDNTNFENSYQFSEQNNSKETDKHITSNVNISKDIKLGATKSSDNYENSQPYEENDTICEDFDMTEEESNSETIPYKVLEELNKIKIYLKGRDRRMSCDGYSTDSGYRSESQTRSSSRGGLNLSAIAINQSAYCLFNYLIRCDLISATRDIISEIALNLSGLIDKLHEEENYPSFLEELLDTIDILLRQVFKGQVDSEFIKNEEYIQRILLLNESVHIQKNTIEKIIKIIKSFHENITDQNTSYELKNINEMENSSYIFHILEIIVKKYINNKNISSQNSTQISQNEDKILKKSQITDIWRKKWNPNLKADDGIRENRCVLKECSEILNKIVVDCVNTYSLVAFAALKCFNLIQS